MTFEKYNKDIAVLFKEFEKHFEETHGNYDGCEYCKVVDFQRNYMTEFLKDYRKTADTTARKVIADIVDTLINWSETGVSFAYLDEYVDTIEEQKKLAAEIDKAILEGDVGDMLLEAPLVYEENGVIVYDCNFGGYYCPGWDGLTEEY